MSDTYPGTDMLKQLCGDCGEVIESLADGWDDTVEEQFVCTRCKDATMRMFAALGVQWTGYVPMKDVIT